MTFEQAKQIQHKNCFDPELKPKRIEEIETTKNRIKHYVTGATLENADHINNVTAMLYIDDLNHIIYNVVIVDDRANILKFIH